RRPDHRHHRVRPLRCRHGRVEPRSRELGRRAVRCGPRLPHLCHGDDVGRRSWRNNPTATTPLLPQALGSSYTVETFPQARAVFDAGNCGARRPGDAVGCLASQLLAAKLNVASGASDCIVPTITTADAFLTDVPYVGPTGHYSLSRPRRTEAIGLQQALASYNSGTPCP